MKKKITLSILGDRRIYFFIKLELIGFMQKEFDAGSGMGNFQAMQRAGLLVSSSPPFLERAFHGLSYG